ncbi:MAG TPA: hypothetical protein VMU01_00015 [Rhizomicrobium sp.]|nr:hypothetical protein [Rhizomicrobium sp.]
MRNFMLMSAAALPLAAVGIAMPISVGQRASRLGGAGALTADGTCLAARTPSVPV